MKGYKHLEILGSLSIAELNKFTRYIKSPFFNESGIIGNIHKHYCGMIKKNNVPDHSMEKLYKAVYPGEKLNGIKLRKMVSLYTRHLENFLVYNEFSEEADTKKLLLMRSLRNRNLGKILAPLIETALTVARKRKVRSYDDYIYLLKLQDEEYSYFSNTIKGEGKKEWFKDQMKKFAEVTELSIVASTLSVLQVVYYHNASEHGSDQGIFLMDEVLNRIKNPGELNYRDEYHYIYSKYLIVKIVMDRTNKLNYKTALEYIIANKDKFTEGFVYYALISIYILATDEITCGFKDFSVILVEIYKAMDEGNLFATQGKLHYIFFMEITNACIYCGETSLAENMIAKYSGAIDPLTKYDSINICRAQILFSRKDYSGAIRCISKMNYATFFLYMEAKILQCKIYYKLRDIEGLYALIDAAGQYFRRNKDLPSAEEKLSYRNFFATLKKMTRLTVKGNIEDLYLFSNEIAKQQFYNHDWITTELENILQA